jgi:hypothetical protein
MNNIYRGITAASVLIVSITFMAPASAQRPAPVPPDHLGLAQGIAEYDTPQFSLKLSTASQTVTALQPKGSGGFDFTPADKIIERAANGFYHLGDITLRVREGETGAWREFSTATRVSRLLRCK